MGLEKADFADGDEINKECSLFWIFDFPFNLDFDFKNLERYQRLNHIPGNYALTSKSILGTTTDSKYIPKAFMSSEELQNYAEKNPEKRFVQKKKNNRGVVLKKASEMNFTITESLTNNFGQEYIENPLLFDGHKFDFGVYVVITSVNPLRFYYYNDNVVIRLCSLPYNPDNFDDLKTYVVSDDHIPGTHFKTIEEYYNMSYSFKTAMNAYFTGKGYDMNKVWNQVEDCIRSVIVSRNDYFMASLKNYKSKFSFFELYRFDMILDDALNLYLLEVNQSPNIYAGNMKKQNRYLFEHLVYSTLNLVGVGSPLKRSSFEPMTPDAEILINNPRTVSVLPNVCMQAPCNESCDSYKCELCRQCMSEDQKYDTIVALQEQTNRGAFKRLFPVSNYGDFGSVDFDELSSADQMHFDWFVEMCKTNKHFCFFVFYFNENYEIRLKSVKIEAPKYWVHHKHNHSWIFSSVENVLEKMGVEKIEMKVDENRLYHMEWNLLWSYDYHGQLPIDFSKLLYHQKINHIPGNYVIVTKDILNSEDPFFSSLSLENQMHTQWFYEMCKKDESFC
ncbi:unnamed protein product [Diamesa serratosioi]